MRSEFKGTYYVYNESWNGTSAISIPVTKGEITLAGAGSGLTILDAQHKTSSTVNGGQHLTVIWNGANDVTFSGFTVKRGDHGIRSNGSVVKNVTFNDVVADDNFGAGFVFEGAGFETVTFKNSEAKNSGDFGIFFNGDSTTNKIVLSNTSANGNGHVGFSVQGKVASLDIKGGTFNDNTGGPTLISYGVTNTYYGFGLELRNAVGTLKYVTMKNNGSDGPNILNGLYGNEGGAGIVLKDGVKLSNNITITNADIQGNMNGVWIEDPDSMKNWNAVFTGNATITLSNIINNPESDVWNFEDDVTINAEKNWWGDFDPSDQVKGKVDYDPYLGGPIIGFINGNDWNNNGFADLHDFYGVTDAIWGKDPIIIANPDLVKGGTYHSFLLEVQLDGPTAENNDQGKKVKLDVTITMGQGPAPSSN